MENNSLHPIIKELNNIIQNKPISQEFMNYKFTNSEFSELHDVICYLSNSFEEVKVFIQSMCEGNIEVEPPGRYNFLAGYLKELLSISKYIAWKTAQVAKGDYNQRIDYLGAFSDNFNLMVQQLKDRESKLKKNAVTLEHSIKLLTSIIEVQEDWVLVVDTTTRNILYANKSAKDYFYNPDTRETYCKKECPLLQTLIQTQQTEEEFQSEYCCVNCFRCISIKSFPIEWDDKNAMVHFLKDLTEKKAEEDQLSNLAYKDELTGIYNRRYCLEKIERLISQQILFSLVLIDLDGLKFVNDTFGHLAGDTYICSVVEVVQHNIRDADILSRVGGDEFIIILPKCSEKLAFDKMESIRSQLKGIKREYPLSLSYGITYVSKGNQLPIKELINELDKKMYVFKEENRKSKHK
ncbi:diguanylate cyclase [Oscillospiraceae bacterium PP1C4]